MKKTVVIGATDNPERFAYRAANKLAQSGYEVVPVGIRKGQVAGFEILDLKDNPKIEGVDTVTLYVGPANQPAWIDYILNLKPRRIIFNPGTENPELMRLASEKGIEIVIDCTLIMLSSGEY